MSYEIIKSIKVKEDRVFINCASNNVSPRWYNEEECPSLSKILQEQGRDALDLVIFKEYENGNFQRGTNKYTRALKVLRFFPEYSQFDWRGENDERRDSPAFDAILKRALKTRLPKDKFILSKPYRLGECYLLKVTKRFAKWTGDKDRAKVFRYKQEAETLKQCFRGSDDWQIINA